MFTRKGITVGCNNQIKLGGGRVGAAKWGLSGRAQLQSR
jgi:hypothetical protein